MDALYQKPVFDEWVVVTFAKGVPTVVFYNGPREETFSKTLHTDLAPLAREMQDKKYAVGDFEFAQDGRGSRLDACMRVGENAYLFCNNTYGSMADLRQDARWLKAQKPFLDLTEKFRGDPLV